MTNLKQHLVFIFSLGAFAYTAYVMGNLTWFLSRPQSIPKTYVWIISLLDSRSRLSTAYKPILVDTLLLVLFVLQHSLMNTIFVKNLWKKLNLEAAQRSIYTLTSSICLQYLMDNWISAPTIILWQFRVDDNEWVRCSFLAIQVYAWLIIYGGSLLMDLPDMVGIKQAYHAAIGRPASFQATAARILYQHVRHPSFIGLSIVLWCTNLMTIDRLLMAIILTAYMYNAWCTDRQDYVYQKCQLRRRLKHLKP